MKKFRMIVLRELADIRFNIAPNKYNLRLAIMAPTRAAAEPMTDCSRALHDGTVDLPASNRFGYFPTNPERRSSRIAPLAEWDHRDSG
jgi:hypothetical protein